MTALVLTEVDDGVAVVTLNRPEARNALSSDLLAQFGEVMDSVDADPDVRAIVLTGADPAFCAGLDLKELGSTGANLGAGARGTPFTPPSKPLIGAINGSTVTGGLEVALQCDFLVASERARFADTHARVGVMPGWGLTVLLPQAIGWRRAKEMSLTGNYVDATEALALGLVNHVVPHDQLLPTATGLARDIASNDPDAVATLLQSYKECSLVSTADALAVENRVSREWRGRGFDPAEVERRRVAIIARGRAQVAGAPDS